MGREGREIGKKRGRSEEERMRIEEKIGKEEKEGRGWNRRGRRTEGKG